MSRAWRMAVPIVALTTMVRVAAAQEIAAGLPPVVFRTIERARLAEGRGDHESARRALDSLVAQLPSGTEALAEALFWRATFAAEGSEAVRDYRRLIVEVPLGTRTEEALFRVAEYEIVRGAAAEGRAVLQRLWRDHPSPPAQARTAYWLARSWFDGGDLPRGCGALGEARARVPKDATELATQIQSLWPRCAGVPSARAANGATQALAADSAVGKTAAGGAATGSVTTPAAAGAPSSAAPRATPTAAPSATPTAAQSAAPSAPPTAVPTASPPAPPSAAPSPPRDSTATTTAARGGRFYAVQLVATDSRAEADAVVRRLAGRGIDARVDGDVAPFRVRVGRFATWREAQARLVALKAAGLSGFVAEGVP